MTASSQADAGVFKPARTPHTARRAVVSTALTAVLAVVFGLSVMVEVSNTPDGTPSVDAPVLAVNAASTPAAGLAGEPQPEGPAAAF
jgi:hypothetical protein